LPADVEARLDYKGGLAKYKQDDIWTQNVVTHLQHNLQRKVTAAQTHDVPVILMNPVCNLKDVAPFKSVPDLDLSSQEILELPAQDRIAKLKRLLPDNARNAELHFRLGQAYLLTGDFDSAKKHLLTAKEEDICPLRATEPIYAAIASVQRSSSVPIVDAKDFFESQSPNRLPGHESLVDHVHPTIRGHQQIADLLLAEMKRQKLVTGTADADQQAALFDQHLESLDFSYFQRAKDRLSGLQRWAEGEVTFEKPVTDAN